MTPLEELDWTVSFERELALQLEGCMGLADLVADKLDTAADLLGARHE